VPDGGREQLPTFLLVGELLAAEGSETVELGAAPFLGGSPLAGDVAAILQAVEGRIQGALIDFENLTGDLPDALRNAPAMKRAECERFQYEEIETTLE